MELLDRFKTKLLRTISPTCENWIWQWIKIGNCVQHMMILSLSPSLRYNVATSYPQNERQQESQQAVLVECDLEDGLELGGERVS